RSTSVRRWANNSPFILSHWNSGLVEGTGSRDPGCQGPGPSGQASAEGSWVSRFLPDRHGTGQVDRPLAAPAATPAAEASQAPRWQPLQLLPDQRFITRLMRSGWGTRIRT